MWMLMWLKWFLVLLSRLVMSVVCVVFWLMVVLFL